MVKDFALSAQKLKPYDPAPGIRKLDGNETAVPCGHRMLCRI